MLFEKKIINIIICSLQKFHSLWRIKNRSLNQKSMPNHKITLLPIFQLILTRWYSPIFTKQYTIHITDRQFCIRAPFQSITKLICYWYITLGFSISEQEQCQVKYQLAKCGARLVRLAYVHTKACLNALLHLQHKKCSDPTNFVLYFVKRSFKPPRLFHNPWYRVCDRRFQPRPSKSTCCWNFNITLYDAGWIYPQVPSFILNSCTLNAPTPICLADTSYKSERAE